MAVSMLLTHHTHLQSFLEYLGFEKRYSQNTVISYKTDLEQFFSYISSAYVQTEINTVTSSYIRSWLSELKEDGISAKSINRKISALKSFFKYLLKQGVVSQTPMHTIVSPKVSKRLPVFVEEKNTEILFNYVEFSNDWKGKTAHLILSLLYNTGMRLSELINLTEKQVDVTYSQIKVLGKGNKERIIPVSNKLAREIADYMSQKPGNKNFVKELLVTENGKPLYAKYVYNIVNKYLALITTIEKKSPHILRHTFATHLMNNDADINSVKELLGHASLAATQIYTHNSIEKLKEVHKKAHPKA